jgi:putative oxidoreductase
MPGFLKAHGETIYGLMRIVVGLTFLCHGLQKLFGMFGGMPQGIEMNALLYTAGVIELVGGTLVMIGLRAGWAAFITSGTMAAAYFMAHQPNGALPIQNQGELAVVYCWVFLYIASRGSGKLSVDAALA